MKRSNFLKLVGFLPFVGLASKIEARSEEKRIERVWKEEDIFGGIYVVRQPHNRRNVELGHLGTLIAQVGYCHVLATPHLYLGDKYALNYISDGFTHGDFSEYTKNYNVPMKGYTRKLLAKMFNELGYRPATKEEVLKAIDSMDKNFIV